MQIIGAFVLATLAWLTIGAREAHAQISDQARDESASAQHTDDELKTGANEFGVWGGGSFSSPTLIGTIEDARFGIAGLRYTRMLKAGNSLALKYTVDAIPAAVLSYPSLSVIQTGANSFLVQRTRKSVYAAGLAPIGFQLNFRRRHRVQPFANTSGGFLYFADPIPNSLGKQFNFTADFGGGIQIMLRPNRAATFGYKYHHISNGNRGVVNPGFDSHLIYAGFSIFK